MPLSTPYLFHSRRTLTSDEVVGRGALVCASAIFDLFSRANLINEKQGIRLTLSANSKSPKETFDFIKQWLSQVQQYQFWMGALVQYGLHKSHFSVDDLKRCLPYLSQLSQKTSHHYRDLAFCVMSIFWSLSVEQLKHFQLHDVVKGLPNTILSSSQRNPFVPGRILSTSIYWRFKDLSKRYQVNSTYLARAYKAAFSIKNDVLFRDMCYLMRSLPTLTVDRTSYHRSHENGCLYFNSLRIVVAKKADYRLTLMHELAHVVYMFYMKKNEESHCNFNVHDRVLSRLLTELSQADLCLNKRFSFLKNLMVNRNYKHSQKREEFFCEFFALMMVEPELARLLSMTVPTSFNRFSRMVEGAVKRCKVKTKLQEKELKDEKLGLSLN